MYCSRYSEKGSMAEGNLINDACFLFSLITALLAIFMEFFLTWVHYTLSLELYELKIDFRLGRVCHSAKDVDTGLLNQCSSTGTEFWSYTHTLSTIFGPERSFVIPLTCLNIGIGSCFLCAFMSNPFTHLFKGRISFQLVTLVLSIIAGFFFVASYSQVCFDYQRYLRLDSEYLDLGEACNVFPAVIVCSFIALICHLIEGYSARLIYKWGQLQQYF